MEAGLARDANGTLVVSDLPGGGEQKGAEDTLQAVSESMRGYERTDSACGGTVEVTGWS